MHGLDFVQCVEGSHDAVSQSIIPNSEKHVVEHDFSRGPWWPDFTVDAAWAVEFTGEERSSTIYVCISLYIELYSTHIVLQSMWEETISQII